MARRWTDEEYNTIRELYPLKSDAEIGEIINRSEDTVRRIARKLELSRPNSVEDLDDEIWKDIEGYEGYYQVSNLGRVKSLPRWIYYSDGRKYFYDSVLLREKRNRGYLHVDLTINSDLSTQKVHRLVAKAFIPNPYNLPQVNHKDENKENNCANNLEWCDNDYNIHYGTAIQRAHKNNVQLNPITLTNIETGEKRHYDRVLDAAKDLNVDPSTIYKCLHKKIKQTKGYTVEYG